VSIFCCALACCVFLCCPKSTLTLTRLDNDLFVGLDWKAGSWPYGSGGYNIDAYLSGMSKRQNIIYAAHATVRPINEVYVQLFYGTGLSLVFSFGGYWIFSLTLKISPKSVGLPHSSCTTRFTNKFSCFLLFLGKQKTEKIHNDLLERSGWPNGIPILNVEHFGFWKLCRSHKSDKPLTHFLELSGCIFNSSNIYQK